MKNLNPLFLAVLFFLACNSSTKTGDSLSGQLIGEWRNVSLKVDIHGDSLTVFEANEANWEQNVGIRPIRTFFREDGTYNSAHYTLTDSLFMDVKGTWKVEDDRLLMFQNSPAPDTTICKTVIKNNLVEFDCMVDWDGDGSRDDRYFGVQRKQ